MAVSGTDKWQASSFSDWPAGLTHSLFVIASSGQTGFAYRSGAARGLRAVLAVATLSERYLLSDF